MVFTGDFLAFAGPLLFVVISIGQVQCRLSDEIR
jgi:hypothetical protein